MFILEGHPTLVLTSSKEWTCMGQDNAGEEFRFGVKAAIARARGKGQGDCN